MENPLNWKKAQIEIQASLGARQYSSQTSFLSHGCALNWGKGKKPLSWFPLLDWSPVPFKFWLEWEGMRQSKEGIGGYGGEEVRERS